MTPDDITRGGPPPLPQSALDELRAAAIEDVARALMVGNDDVFKTAEAMVDSLTTHILAQADIR